MTRYNQYNNAIGWVAFAIAAFTYLSTIEPTTSFWDCGEFITTAYRLSVGHPPGAPFFMILGRFFTLFAGNNVENISVTINILSALASAFTIAFLFWTITHMAKRIVVKHGHEPSLSQSISIMGAGIVGALAYTFSDTFWFSAVEGEVYGTSSLITAIVFWAILKWENEADKPYANRWLIFISYMIGLSIGVHLLNLLAIPAIAMVYYFKKYEVNRRGVILSLLLSFVILGAIMYILIPGVVKIASFFELLFVNKMGAPYSSGVIVYSILLTASIVLGIRYTIRNKKVIANTILLSVTVIMIGYSSYAVVVIRSLANPTMDQNDPDNVFGLLSYLNREQYGQHPVFYGQYYNAPLDNDEPYSKRKPTYIKKDGKYVIADYRLSPNYDDRFTTIFPRMYSAKSEHVRGYHSWVKVKGKRVRITNRQGEPETIVKPTFGENLMFFFRYQVGWMYWRYFMWNFSGRQNDIQGHGDVLRGNWITGISFLDQLRLGEQENLPSIYANNAARNKYYLLPLALGLIGLFFQYGKGSRGKKDFWVIMLLFIMTGIAIVVFLNQEPFQPRERDYAYAGSFYAFAIWIGMGVLGIAKWLSSITSKRASSIVATTVCLITVPALMAAENWDDHDRSWRYTARDFGYNYLETCAPNAIIFTNGDNDTFPLWYNQEVEGIRRDIRVCNLSYLQTDWYISQMKRKAYDSEPLPISFEHDEYVQGTNDVVYLINNVNREIDIKDAIDFVKSTDPRTKIRDEFDYIPSKRLSYQIDSLAVFKNNVLTAKDSSDIVKSMSINFSEKNYITKDELMVLDMIASTNWERPIYFATTVGRDKLVNLHNYLQLEGFAYRLIPIETVQNKMSFGRVATDIMYDNIMNKFKWGNINDPRVYLDENNTRMALNVRSNFVNLAQSLIEEGRADSAIAVLDYCIELIPNDRVQYNYSNVLMAEAYFNAANISMRNDDTLSTSKDNDSSDRSGSHAVSQAKEIIDTMLENCNEEIMYFISLNDNQIEALQDDFTRAASLTHELGRIANKYGEKELADTAKKYLHLFQ